MDRSTIVGRGLSLGRWLTCAAACVSACGRAGADDFGVLACWGASGLGQCDPPASLGPVRQVAAGGYHSVALTAFGEVVCWGAGSSVDGHTDKGPHQFGQSVVPADLGVIVQVCAGRHHTVARRIDGALRAWGCNDDGQCSAPQWLGTVIDIAAGGAHTLAITPFGDVAAWGSDADGQCSVPWTVGGARAIAAGGGHSIAVRFDGSVACWGAWADGQCGAPSQLDGVAAVAAGDAHSVALRQDGSVACWGSDSHGQCSAPQELRGVVSIAAGALHTVAALDDGTIVAWGDGASGQCAPPSNAARTQQVSAGRAHALAVVCTERRVDLATGELGPIGSGIVRWAEFTMLPAAVESARVTVRVRADLGAIDRVVAVHLNGTAIGTAFGSGGHACPEQADEQTIFVGPDLMNLILLHGTRDGHALATLRVEITGSPNVKLDACPGGSVECFVTYSARPQGCTADHSVDPCSDTAVGRDCNRNGRRDACDIADGADDIDGDGILDACEETRGDFDLNGRIDASDLETLVTVWWGQRDPYRGDLDGDGVCDAHDLAMLLAAWGETDW